MLNAKPPSPKPPLHPESCEGAPNVKQQGYERGPSTTTSSSTIPSATPDMPQHGAPDGTRVTAANPPLSAASQLNATPESPPPRPSWEMRLAALRQRRRIVNAERKPQSDIAAAAADDDGATAAVSSSSSLAEERGGDADNEVERARQQPQVFVQHSKFSVSPFSSVLSTPTSDDESAEAFRSPLHVALEDSPVAPPAFRATVEYVADGPGRRGRDGGGAEGGSAVVPMPRTRAAVATGVRPPASPAPSGTSSVPASPPPAAVVMMAAAASPGAANVARPAMAGTRLSSRPVPSIMSAASTATFSEEPFAERSFGVFSWRDSPPSRPVRAAPMQPDSHTSDEESQLEGMYEDGEAAQMDWSVGTPPPELSAVAPAGSGPNNSALALEKKRGARAEVTKQFTVHTALLQKLSTPPLTSGVDSSSTSQTNASPPNMSSEVAVEVAQEPYEKATSLSGSLVSSSNGEDIDGKRAAPLSTEAPPYAALPEPFRQAMTARHYPQEKGVSHRIDAKQMHPSTGTQLERREANFSPTSAVAPGTATLSSVAHHEGDGDKTQDKADAKKKCAGGNTQPHNTALTSKGSSEPSNTRPSAPATQQPTAPLTATQTPSDRKPTWALNGESPAKGLSEKNVPLTRQERLVAEGNGAKANFADRDSRGKPLADKKGETVPPAHPVSNATATEMPFQRDARVGRTVPSSAQTFASPPPLTQFRVPRDAEEPVSKNAPATQPATPQEMAAASRTPPTKGPSPTSHANAYIVPAKAVRSDAQQRQYSDPVANRGSALPPLPSLRQVQKAPTLRPLLTQLVSQAMMHGAVQDSGSASPIAPVSPATDAPSLDHQVRTAVPTPSNYTHPATPSSDLLSSPVPTCQRPRAPSPGNSPEARRKTESPSLRSSSFLQQQQQPRYLEPNQPDWHAALVAGVRVHRDSPHTRRPHCPSRERSQTGRITSAWSSRSPGAWDGLMSSVSAERDASLLAESALSSSSGTTLRRAGSAAADRNASSTASRSASVRSLLSTVVYPIFNATSVGLKYNLTDPPPAAPSLRTECTQVIREELELQARLNKLKADSLCRRIERYH
ncbi:hypothetical protein ABB37_05071 [Leptomonas pyrrhocoris]|uniref:Uncharacterized protein n=1 Tax=Leptomonas pyrrhocoris TaxID=157538 RepID=A0A0M9G150_LEPPY|nr:hypothetical protein ABB37_05071 [Leptomonas pyrrhocoris]KPA80056.1 hypothetical protein ABB37_05071 [Leptomonas pyrrhocoris]|eukprot:XP_015658495.1 hypothetical protein ABB37_05071 [Leptomonas pyrrhocoris]